MNHNYLIQEYERWATNWAAQEWERIRYNIDRAGTASAATSRVKTMLNWQKDFKTASDEKIKALRKEAVNGERFEIAARRFQVDLSAKYDEQIIGTSEEDINL